MRGTVIKQLGDREHTLTTNARTWVTSKLVHGSNKLCYCTVTEIVNRIRCFLSTQDTLCQWLERVGTWKKMQLDAGSECTSRLAQVTWLFILALSNRPVPIMTCYFILYEKWIIFSGFWSSPNRWQTTDRQAVRRRCIYEPIMQFA